MNKIISFLAIIGGIAFASWGVVTYNEVRAEGAYSEVIKEGNLAIQLFCAYSGTFAVLLGVHTLFFSSSSRQASDVVEPNQGGADDDGAKKLSHDNAAGNECSPPSERAPPQLSLKEKVIVCFLAMFLGAWICGPLKNACVEAERRHENEH